MKEYQTDKIRNVALLGHGSCGKTTLTESILFTTGVTKRKGRVEDGNTISDYDKEEISRQFSIGTSIIPVEWKDVKYNLLDTPGYFDFIGEVNGALRAATGAVIIVDASSGVEVGTEKAWKYTEKNKLPKIIFLNKMDKENINFDKIMNDLREQFGNKVVPFAVPIGESESFKGFVNIVDMIGRVYDGKDCVDAQVPEGMNDIIEPLREMLMESVAEADEELMEKYFEGEEFTTEEIHRGLRKGIMNSDLVPVLIGSSQNNIGVHTLLNMINAYLPSPSDVGVHEGVKPGTTEKVQRKVDKNEPFSAFVFKTIVDPFVGKISLFNVCSGKISKDADVLNANKDENERFGSLFLLRGKSQIEVSTIIAGDIGATAKLQYTETGDTLCDKNNPIQYNEIDYPDPCLFLAVEPKAKGDEEKIGSSLARMTEEDPTFIVQRNAETKQLLIGGQGNMQLAVITNKLKNTFGVEVELTDPKVPYRETIKGTSSVQGRHKKQSGGAGQYGDVHIRFEPSQLDFEFDEEIFGGSVPRQYIPAVEKGLRESIEKGVLAGYPVVNMKAVLFDGSYHPVDSNEMAFKIAASLAFKKGMEQAKPVLLEPIVRVEILVPEDYMGDIMGDMNKRRGRILGMEQQEDGNQLVLAEAPQTEMFKYAIDLRSMTQARASFRMEFARYEEVPAHISEKIIAEAKAERE
ncbi:translation elongation factor 2 (EF-2/EF-G) [Proteiniborus ethanoligenes]|uniref:Elongation factor G n=1 Tax=Proteiniborus ethanoligenes TaxID=415015 RepID=A0A1H3RJC0_9FIRM|nr:elongation factor G [Proteiniborus ethanoligenes]SDZ25844.1 translation elongation factor 2 (EF-2/EF-G) [Proteiniborus ethanoligenes]